MAEKQTFKVHELNLEDAFDLGGILAAGGLTGQTAQALSQLQRDEGAGLTAITSLIMGALANRTTRDDMKGFLFSLWKTTEDEQADEDDLDMADRLKPRYVGSEPEKGTLFYRKLKRFKKLPPDAAVGLVTAVVQAEGFQDFLASLRRDLPNLSSAPQTESNGPTDLHPARSDA